MVLIKSLFPTYGKWNSLRTVVIVFGLLISQLAFAASDSSQPMPIQLLEAAKQDPVLATEFEKAIAQWEQGTTNSEANSPQKSDAGAGLGSPWTATILEWDRLVNVAKAKRGADDIFTRLAEFYLGDSYRREKSYLSAIPLLKRAVEASERFIGAEHFYTSRAKESLAEAYKQAGFPALARPLAEQALKQKVSAYGLHHDDVAVSQKYLAGIYGSLGMHQAALDLSKQASNVWKELYGIESAKYWLAQHETAGYLYDLGRYTEAVSVQEDVLHFSANYHGKNSFSTLAAIHNLATSLASTGQYDRSLNLKKSGLEVARSLYGASHPNYISTVQAIASDEAELGQTESASRRLDELLQSIGATQEVGSLQRASILLDLGELRLTQGDFETARRLISEARKIAIDKQSLGTEILAEAKLARIYRLRGDLTEARRIQKKVLDFYQENLGSLHPETARAQIALGSTRSREGNLDVAIDLKWAAIRSLVTVFPQGHPDVATAFVILAYDLKRNGEDEAAIAVMKNGINMNQHARQTVSLLGSDLLSSYTATVESSYQVLAGWLVEHERFEEAQQVLDMLKQEEQFTFVRRDQFVGSTKSKVAPNVKEQPFFDRYSSNSSQLFAIADETAQLKAREKLGLSSDEASRLRLLKLQLQSAQKDFEQILAQLRKDLTASGPAGAASAVEVTPSVSIGARSLVRALGTGTVLLRYFITDNAIGILFTSGNAEKGFSSRIDRKELHRLVFEYRQMLRDPTSNALPHAQKLYSLLLEPIEADLAQVGAKTVMLQLDGALRRIPFGSLHDGHRYASQKWGLPFYTSVVGDRLRDTNRQQWRAAGLGLTRAVGEFKALPSVKAEIDSIVRSRSALGVFDGSVYLDDDFGASRLREVGRQNYQLMHIASHFQLSPGTEINSFLLLGDGQRLTLGDLRTQNYRFDNVDLLTLSACDTGLGGDRDNNGKEIEGFGVIAQQQGAKAVLATLWPVADQSTSILMTDMYRRRQSQGLSKIEALRQAQLALMAQPKYSHPFYWAPFILMGNWK